MTRSLLVAPLSLILIVGLVADGFGQPPGRGGRGGPPSGFRGGPPGSSGRGGPPSSGGSSGFDPSSFLRRLDTNGNGVIDTSESQGRARYFLERIPGIDINRPIPIDRLSRAVQKMREERERSGSSRDSGRSYGSAPEVEPLVPGFGIEDVFEPVLGFGSAAEQFAVSLDDADYKEADQTLARNDRNKDGLLDQEEIRRGRWRDDPMRQDRNGDGKLTRNELALRYAMRRTTMSSRDSGRSSSNSSSRSGSSSSRDSGRGSSSRSGWSWGGRGGDSRGGGGGDRTEMLMRLVERYDANKNGVWEKSEWGSFRSSPADGDKNKDGKITKDEMKAYLGARYGGSGSSSGRSGWGGGGGWGGSSRGGGSSSSKGGARKIVGKSFSDRSSYSIPSAVDRLDDVPEWFKTLDSNEDGQVKMAEYSASWSKKILEEFRGFDLNSDRVLTPIEVAKAIENGAERGDGYSSGSRRPSRGDRTASSRSNDKSDDKSDDKDDKSDSASSEPSKPKSGDSKYLRYAQGYIQKYDANKDGVLVKDEWSKMRRDYSFADKDKDGKITVEEMAVAMQRK